MFDTGIAMQNLCLAAHALGLGTVVVGWFDHKKVEEILGVPQECRSGGYDPSGIPNCRRDRPKKERTIRIYFL